MIVNDYQLNLGGLAILLQFFINSSANKACSVVAVVVVVFAMP